jgi:hypothetical protein
VGKENEMSSYRIDSVGRKLVKAGGMAAFYAGYYAAIVRECMNQARMEKRHTDGKLICMTVRRARWANKQYLYWMRLAKAHL